RDGAGVLCPVPAGLGRSAWPPEPATAQPATMHPIATQAATVGADLLSQPGDPDTAFNLARAPQPRHRTWNPPAPSGAAASDPAVAVLCQVPRSLASRCLPGNSHPSRREPPRRFRRGPFRERNVEPQDVEQRTTRRSRVSVRAVDKELRTCGGMPGFGCGADGGDRGDRRDRGAYQAAFHSVESVVFAQRFLYCRQYCSATKSQPGTGDERLGVVLVPGGGIDADCYTPCRDALGHVLGPYRAGFANRRWRGGRPVIAACRRDVITDQDCRFPFALIINF